MDPQSLSRAQVVIRLLFGGTLSCADEMTEPCVFHSREAYGCQGGGFVLGYEKIQRSHPQRKIRVVTSLARWCSALSSRVRRVIPSIHDCCSGCRRTDVTEPSWADHLFILVPLQIIVQASDMAIHLNSHNHKPGAKLEP